ncbi:MAG: tyrosine-type recombinase/integrase [Acidimicrobiales bacterium]
MEVWTPGQTKQFLTSSVDHPLHTLFFLAATTGMRRGELAGLRWSDVNLDDGYLDISNTRTSVGYEVLEGRPKSKKSERRVALDASDRDSCSEPTRRLRGCTGWQQPSPSTPVTTCS